MSVSGQRWRDGVRAWLRRLGLGREWALVPVAAAIGVLAGLVAVGLDGLISRVRDALYGDLAGNLAAWLPSGALMVLLLPAAGGLLVGLLGRAMVIGGRGHGVPDVIAALTRRTVLPIKSAVFRFLGCTVTLGSGGSAGFEGPILYIGATLASKLRELLRLDRQHAPVLLGCGGAAATAAIFHAPIAGVLFVLEVVLRDFTLKTFVPIVVAAVFGTAMSEALAPAGTAVFELPMIEARYHFSLIELGAYTVLGILVGLLGAGFAAMLAKSEGLADRWKAPFWIKPVTGGLLLGGLGLVYLNLAGRSWTDTSMPAVFGNGYPVISHLLAPSTYAGHLGVSLLLLTVACKAVAVCLTLASGGVGGVIGPSLYMGAGLGAAFGLVLQSLGWFPQSSPAAYALAGMAGFIAATVHCPLTAFLLVFEITQDYKAVLPMMLVAIAATAASQSVRRGSVYTSWLRTQGVRVGQYADTTLLRRLEVRHVPLVQNAILRAEDPAQRLLTLSQNASLVDFAVADEKGHSLGMVVGQDVRATLLEREAIPLMIVGELMRTDLPTVHGDDTLEDVLDKFAKHDVSSLVMVGRDGRVKGMVTRTRLMEYYHDALEQEA